jgi:LDH2 family malate/lactate/ureidoglycolate dehydrogenase
MASDSRRYTARQVEAFLVSAFVALEVPEADARIVSQLMVRADLYGYDTHGTFRLRQYVNRLRDGGTNPRPDIAIAVERDSTAVVGGDNGLGHLAMRFAAELAMTKAEAHGIGWVGVRNGNHAGPASLYVNMPASRDMIGLYAAVGSANHVPPFGGVDLLLGTNPIAIAVPAGKSPPFVLDMATTVAAAGKIKTLAQRGESMPEGWMVGRDGRPLTDPTRHQEGLLLPIGGAKGYGLAMAIGLLAGVLNGAAFGRDVVDFTSDTKSATNTGQFIAAISIAAFADVDTFKAAVDEVLGEMRQSEPLPGHEAVRIPGDRRGAIYEDRSANGIPLHRNLVKTLADISAELQLEELT